MFIYFQENPDGLFQTGCIHLRHPLKTSCGAVNNVLDCSIVVREFEFQSCLFDSFTFRLTPLRKV